jgi:hypothetical protein
LESDPRDDCPIVYIYIGLLTTTKERVFAKLTPPHVRNRHEQSQDDVTAAATGRGKVENEPYAQLVCASAIFVDGEVEQLKRLAYPEGKMEFAPWLDELKKATTSYDEKKKGEKQKGEAAAVKRALAYVVNPKSKTDLCAIATRAYNADAEYSKILDDLKLNPTYLKLRQGVMDKPRAARPSKLPPPVPTAKPSAQAATTSTITETSDGKQGKPSGEKRSRENDADSESSARIKKLKEGVKTFGEMVDRVEAEMIKGFKARTPKCRLVMKWRYGDVEIIFAGDGDSLRNRG